MSAMDGAVDRVDPAADPEASADQPSAGHPGSSADARSVTDAAAPALAGTAPARAGVWSVADLVVPPPLPDLEASSPRGARLAVFVTAVAVIGVLGGFGWLIFAAWNYVTTASDAAQQQHWEQLRGLIDVASAIVLLVIGTVLGTSLQSRWTTAAREQATRQARAAGEQHAAAVANADAARTNAAAVQTAAADLATALALLGRARPLLSELEQLAADRDRTKAQFVTAIAVMSATREPHVAGFRIEQAGDVRLAETVDDGVDRTITSLAARAEIAAAEITGWLSTRR
jgi:hypothetical protein